MSQVSPKEQAKALKGPDAFQVRIMDALSWLVQNTRLVALVLVPVGVIALSIFAWQYYSQTNKDNRLEELAQIQLAFDAELKLASDARTVLLKQIEAIDQKIAAAAPKADPAKAGEAPVAPPEDPQLKAEKDAIEKKIAAIKPDHAATAPKFKGFYDRHPKTPEGWRAGSTAARIFADQNQLAEARAVLEGILEHAKDNVFYQTLAGFSLIGILEEQGEFDRALAQLELLDKLVVKDLKPRVLLAKGRIHLLKKDQTQAKQNFDALIDAHSASPEAQKARSLRALVN